MVQFKADALLKLSNLELEKFKGNNVSIQTKSCLIRGVITGFLVDNMNLSEVKIIGFQLGCNNTVKFNDIDLMNVIGNEV